MAARPPRTIGSSDELLVEATPEPVLGALGADAFAVGDAADVEVAAVGEAEGDSDGEADAEGDGDAEGAAPSVPDAVGLPPAGVWADADPPP